MYYIYFLFFLAFGISKAWMNHLRMKSGVYYKMTGEILNPNNSLYTSMRDIPSMRLCGLMKHVNYMLIDYQCIKNASIVCHIP